jgi:hypothetical protein
MKKNHRKNKNSWQFARASVIALILVSLLGFIIGFLVNHPEFLARQDNRGKASVPGGKTSFLIAPATGTFSPGEAVTLNISGYLPLETQIDGLQGFLVIEGSLPTDIVFEPHVPAGLSLLSVISAPTENKWLIKFAYIETNLGIAYGGQGLVSLGDLKFIASTEGGFTVAFDPVYSKVMEHGSMIDILNSPTSYDYEVTGIAPSPMPSVTPNPSGLPPLTPTNPIPTKKGKKPVLQNSSLKSLQK